MMEDIGCSFVAALLIHPRKRTTLSLPRKEPLCQRWSRLLAPDGMLRKILKTGKISAWTTTKCGASSGGTGTLRSCYWLLLTLQEFTQQSISPLVILRLLRLLPTPPSFP